MIIFVISVTMILIIILHCIIKPYIEARAKAKKEEEKAFLIKMTRCKNCKNCKMLYDIGYVVCDKMDFKTPMQIPDDCHKSELEGLPDIPFEELENFRP